MLVLIAISSIWIIATAVVTVPGTGRILSLASGAGLLQTQWATSHASGFVIDGNYAEHTLRWTWWPAQVWHEATAPFLGIHIQSVTLPIWLLLLLAVAASVGLRFLAGCKSMPGHCRKCGYDLTGLTIAACPECGSQPPAASPGHE